MVNPKTLEELLATFPTNQKETIQNLRVLIKNSVPETVELLKNGKFTYRIGERDFVWLSVFQDHVDVEFAMGASLDSNLLKTRGVAEKNDNVRHISVGNFEKVKSELTKLLKQAATVGLEHCPTK